jgi:hypothetical protein
VPETTVKVSYWLGWACAAATLPPGSARSSITTRSPSVFGRRLDERHALAGDGVDQCLSCLDHFGLLARR